jgi:hypothetical protein
MDLAGKGRQMFHRSVFMAVCSTAILSAGAHAEDVVPGSSAAASAVVGGIDSDSSNGFTSASAAAHGPNAGASSAVNLAGKPSAASSATAGTLDLNGASAFGEFEYSVAVSGPDTISVPILYSVSLSAVAGWSSEGLSQAGAFASFGLEDPTMLTAVGGDACSVGSAVAGVACSGYTGDPTTGVMDIHAGLEDLLFVNEQTSVGALDGAFATAFADPYFVIDPNFLLANPGYSLVISDGVGNLPDGVPEPATWAMMLLGAGLVGSGLRMARRPNNTSPSAV